MSQVCVSVWLCASFCIYIIKGKYFCHYICSTFYLCELGGHVYVLGGCHELCLCMSVRVILYHYEGVQLMLSLYSILYLCELGGHVLGRCYNSIILK